MRTEIREFLSKIQNLSVDAKARGEAALPENCFFLSDFEIVCMKRDNGDSRYPYSADGFTLWAYSSGYISVNESTYYVILPASGGKEPFMTAFGGIYESGAYLPVSLFGSMALPAEKDCRRYTVYTPRQYIISRNVNRSCLRCGHSYPKKRKFVLRYTPKI